MGIITHKNVSHVMDSKEKLWHYKGKRNQSEKKDTFRMEEENKYRNVIKSVLSKRIKNYDEIKGLIRNIVNVYYHIDSFIVSLCS